MSAYEAASLWPQWISAGAALLAVGVAIVFGGLTLSNTRRTKDAQERATFAAATDPIPADLAEAIADVGRVNWAVEQGSGETWLLRNIGSNAAHDVTVTGLTDLDKQRLTAPESHETVGPTGVISFVLVSRFSLSGPANIEVSFKFDVGGPPQLRIVRVPST